MSLITVILTTLNSAKYVRRSVESCLNQTHQDIELLVVDGGSEDGTLQIVGALTDPRIRVIHQPGNTGKLPGAINLGMAESRGDYITWTQDDCWYEPDALETMLGYLEAHPEVGLVYADYWEVNEEGESIRYQQVHGPEDLLVDDVVRVCFLFRRCVYETVGPQETKYFPVHEPPWRIKVANRFLIEPIHVPLMHYTVHDASLTGRIGGWELQRQFLSALRDEGHITNRAYSAARARAVIDQGYEACLFRHDYGAFLGALLACVPTAPRLLCNRGLLKLALRVLLPGRARHCDQLAERWQHRDERTQLELTRASAQSGRAPAPSDL